MVKHRIWAALFALLLCATIATPRAKAEEGTSIGIIGGADGPTAVFVSGGPEGSATSANNETFTLDIQDMIAMIGDEEMLSDFVEIDDPVAFLDAYEAYLIEYYGMLDAMYALLGDTATMPVGDRATLIMPTRYTLLYPGTDLRITFSMNLASSNPDALAITTFAPATQPDAETGGLLVRNIESSAVRIDGIAPGNARIAYLVQVEASIGKHTRTIVSSYSAPWTVGDEGDTPAFDVHAYTAISAYDVLLASE